MYWRELIKYCADNGGYTGCDLPDLKQQDSMDRVEQDISHRLTANKKLNTEKHDLSPAVNTDGNMDSFSSVGDHVSIENDKQLKTKQHTPVINTDQNMPGLLSAGVHVNKENAETPNTLKSHHIPELNDSENTSSLISLMPTSSVKTNDVLDTGDRVNTADTSQASVCSGGSGNELDLLNNAVLNRISQASSLETKLTVDQSSMTSAGDCRFTSGACDMTDVRSKVKVTDILPHGSVNGGSHKMPTDAVWCSDIEHVLQNGKNSSGHN